MVTTFCLQYYSYVDVCGCTLQVHALGFALVCPVLLTSSLLVVMGVAINNLSADKARRYPVYAAPAYRVPAYRTIPWIVRVCVYGKQLTRYYYSGHAAHGGATFGSDATPYRVTHSHATPYRVTHFHAMPFTCSYWW